MSRKFLFVVLLLISLLAASLSLSVMAAPDGPDIVGGEEAAPGAWPWQAALVHSDTTNLYDGQYCGGVLVDELWVLTAAHCVDDFSIAEFDVALGVHNLLKPEANYQRIAPREVVIHPDFNPYTLDSDLALIQLETPAVFTSGEGGGLPVQPAALIAPDAGTLVDMLSTVTGWGNTAGQPDPGGFDYPNTLQQVELPILSNEACNEAFYNNYFLTEVTENMMCAGFIYKGGRDSCYGDSGGPLVVQDPDTAEWNLAGLVSWGIGCAMPGLPGVYTRLSQFTPWVSEILQRPAVNIEKSAAASAVRPGDVLGYTLVVKNIGLQTVEALPLLDEVPAGTSVVPGSISSGGVLQEGVISWEMPPLEVDETFSAGFSVLVDEDYLETADYFSDNIEGAPDAWSVSHDSAYTDTDWAVTDTYSHSPDKAWFAPDLDVVSDMSLILDLPGILPSNMALSFWHFYDLESNFDGGVIEISTDGGNTWTDLGPHILQNGYDHVLIGDTLNPLAGREAFSGYSYDWLQTLVDLSGFAGKEVQIRFRLATDQYYAVWGWFVDDVHVGRQPDISNQAAVKSVTSNVTQTAVLTWLPTDTVYLPVLVPPGVNDTPPPGYPGPFAMER
jgi:uncharacterized repeat protein (TIGR01451 family)